MAVESQRSAINPFRLRLELNLSLWKITHCCCPDSALKVVSSGSVNSAGEHTDYESP